MSIKQAWHSKCLQCCIHVYNSMTDHVVSHNQPGTHFSRRLILPLSVVSVAEALHIEVESCDIPFTYAGGGGSTLGTVQVRKPCCRDFTDSASCRMTGRTLGPQDLTVFLPSLSRWSMI